MGLTYVSHKVCNNKLYIFNISATGFNAPLRYLFKICPKLVMFSQNMFLCVRSSYTLLGTIMFSRKTLILVTLDSPTGSPGGEGAINPDTHRGNINKTRESVRLSFFTLYSRFETLTSVNKTDHFCYC